MVVYGTKCGKTYHPQKAQNDCRTLHAAPPTTAPNCAAIWYRLNFATRFPLEFILFAH